MILYGSHPNPDSINEPLIPLLEDLRRKSPCSNLAGSTGWSGQKTLFDLPEAQDLHLFLRNKIRAQHPGTFIIQGWGNILESNEYILMHNHENGSNFMSGVYYLTPAALYLSNAGRGWGDHVNFAAGDYILFPPALKHSVTPSPNYRISIAFNAYV